MLLAGFLALLPLQNRRLIYLKIKRYNDDIVLFHEAIELFPIHSNVSHINPPCLAFALLQQTCLGSCQVTLIELSRPSPSLPEILSGMGSTLVGVDVAVKEMLRDLTLGDGVQARVDGILFQRLEGTSNANPIFALLKDYLSSL